MDYHLHLLRHYAVSAALGAGVPVRDVSARAGHSSARMTLDRYSHVMEPGSAAAAEAIVKGLRKSGDGRARRGRARR